MKIKRVTANNRRKAFEVTTARGDHLFPYAQLSVAPLVVPSRDNPIVTVYVDKELAREAFTYELADGAEGSVHIDHVLHYNRDPRYLRDQLLYKLTLEARQRVDASGLSKREMIRRLGTSATQFYRLLDATNTTKSLDQMMKLLHVLDCDVDLVVKPPRRSPKGKQAV